MRRDYFVPILPSFFDYPGNHKGNHDSGGPGVFLIKSLFRMTQYYTGYEMDKHFEEVKESLKKENAYLLTATENGFAKRTLIPEYRLQSRGGKGVINIKLSPKIGEVKALILVRPDDEVMCITQKGILIRAKVQSIRVSGRSTQGVKIINLEKGDKLSTIARIVPEE